MVDTLGWSVVMMKRMTREWVTEEEGNVRGGKSRVGVDGARDAEI